MAREYAPIRLDIWSDDEFRNLTPEAQHLYFVLVTAPSMSYAGTVDWRPARIGALAKHWGKSRVETAARELAENLFIVVDEDTEEAMIRSYVKHDGLMKNPKTAVSMALAFAGTASKSIRGVLVHELRKLHENQRELKGWTADKVVSILDRDAVDPASYPTGFRSIQGVTESSPEAAVGGNSKQVYPLTFGNSGGNSEEGLGEGSLPAPTPAPTPSTSNEVDNKGGEFENVAATPEKPRKRATRIPENFMPNEAIVEKTRSDCPLLFANDAMKIHHEKFCNYWESATKNATKLDWSKTWRNWMLEEQVRMDARTARTEPTRGHYGDPGITKRMREHAEIEAMKDNPDIRILEAAGIAIPEHARHLKVVAEPVQEVLIA